MTTKSVSAGEYAPPPAETPPEPTAPTADLTASDFAVPGPVLQIGVAPFRIDILTELTGLTFGEAWADRDRGSFGDLQVDFIGRAAFVKNKRATGRPRDLADVHDLEQP